MQLYKYVWIVLMALLPQAASAQQYLNKSVTLNAENQPVSKVLNDISREGNFIFSYNTNIIRKDSLVTIHAKNKTVRQVLDQLFGGKISYKVKERYVILQTADGSQFWYVTGYVVDGKTGARISEASVYEPKQLVATLTNQDGYFRMKLKEKHPVMAINVSKLSYDNVIVPVQPGYDQELTVNISPRDYELDSVVVTQHSRIERSWYGRLFLSSRQKLQSINLNKFFVDKPYQVSLTPGLGTHGKMSSQVANKLSLNIFGGYSAAINGFEMGGLFNIVKNDMQYVELAGLFNVVGGDVRGVQIAGIHNQVEDSVAGVQVAGISNFTGKDFTGVQVAGIYNQASGNIKQVQASGIANYVQDTMEGVQAAGISNVSMKKMTGVQAAGISNTVLGDVDGIQVAGIINYAKRLNGMQVGLINIADTSSGYSIGLINLVRKGYHKLTLSNTEVAHFNLSFKTGNEKLYTILFAGMNAGEVQKSWTFGLGLGTEIGLGKIWSFNPEVTTQHLYLGDWDRSNILSRVTLNLQVKITPYLTLFGGPSYSIYTTDQHSYPEYYRSPVPDYGGQQFDKDVWGWIGWNAGISIF